MDYILYEFFTKDEVERNWLVSILGDYKFEGFEETSDSLKAYIPAGESTSVHVKDILYHNDLHHILFEHSEIQEKNWNEEWEKNFQPVTIAGQVGIRAPFHEVLGTQIELVIEPKMSFGTGHHPTTALMVELMLNRNFENKTVLDFGSGTGVLAILAEKLNAAKVLAIDNEDWAYKNCMENTLRNGCVKVECFHGDQTLIFKAKFDIILANINRHVILENMGRWNSYLKPGGIMMVSGILAADEKDIMAAATRFGLHLYDVKRETGWIALTFEKQ
jgi:ribosomal protein L11 methyltransferase